MGARTVVMTVMGGTGHVQRLRPLMAALVARGIETWVYTERAFEREVVAEGARFSDLFAGRPLKAADDESRPIPCRYVSFAGLFAEPVAREMADRRPALMISDSFALIGRVVARILGLPHVDVCAGHDVDPTRFVERIEPERIKVSPDCLHAAEILRDTFGVEDASPFSYGTCKSSLLNVCCEPEMFISNATRRALEPVAFFGSLPSLDEIDRRDRMPGRQWFGPDDGGLRLYVSFGTVAWWYYQAEAVASLRTIVQAITATSGVQAVISLGNASVPLEELAALRQANVEVEPYVNQWQVLREADVFLTHHGLNSTHEAIYRQVPMISHPFFADQPAMATTCQNLGIAVPLAASVRSVIDGWGVAEAVEACVAQRATLDAALTGARASELEVISRRSEVVERILALR